MNPGAGLRVIERKFGHLQARSFAFMCTGYTVLCLFSQKRPHDP